MFKPQSKASKNVEQMSLEQMQQMSLEQMQQM
jgi:hypothetical protein